MARRVRTPPPPYRGSLPPRPDLGRLMMSAGFIFVPTYFLEACQRRCGDYFTLLPEPRRVLVLTADPAAIKQVFTGAPNLLHAGEGNVALQPILGDRSVLLLDGDEHMRQRRLLLPPFHGERMRAYAAAMTEVAERHVAAWPRRSGFPSLPSMQAMTMEIILRAVLGIQEPGRLAQIGPPLRAVMDTVASRRRVLTLILAGSRTGPRSPWGKFVATRRAADRLLYAEIAARRAEPDHEPREDVFSLLLAARDEQGEPLSDRELRDELMTLLVAGHETTATALAWCLERLARHPRVLERLLDEQRDGGEAYLDAVVKETLRLRPVVPAVARRLQAPMQFGPWELPAGITIAPSIYLLHRNPELYPDPTAFRPERFLERPPGTYEWIPFGGGVRRCLGASFALLEMRIVLQAVLRGVRLRPARGRHGEATMRRAITLAPARGGRIVVEPTA